MKKENIITHLQIIHTWASFARERDLQFFTEKHLEDITEWTDDAIALLKEQDKQKQKWLQCIADNQLAIGGADPLTEYEQGVWDGLEMAYNILTEEG